MIETFTYNAWHKTKYEPLYLECEVEFTPVEIGSREFGTGLQLEPDYAESMTILSIKVGGVDIMDVVSEHVLQDIVQYHSEVLEERRIAYYD